MSCKACTITLQYSISTSILSAYHAEKVFHDLAAASTPRKSNSLLCLSLRNLLFLHSPLQCHCSGFASTILAPSRSPVIVVQISAVYACVGSDAIVHMGEEMKVGSMHRDEIRVFRHFLSRLPERRSHYTEIHGKFIPVEWRDGPVVLDFLPALHHRCTRRLT